MSLSENPLNNDSQSGLIEADFVVSAELSQQRLDQVLSELMSDYSRAQIQRWIKSDSVTVNGQVLRPKDKVKMNDLISVAVELESNDDWLAEDICLDIVFEDEAIAVINKPAGLVVHPAPGHRTGTLVNALLFRYPGIETVPRAGIVHRLDKETSGLMVVAKDLKAHAHLVKQLQARTMGREYEAVAVGVMTGGGSVEEPIARHPKQRKKMAVHPFGKPAMTHYRVLRRFAGHTHIRVKLETGRTHQIRVHMAHMNYPLVGDPVYGGRQRIPAQLSAESTEFVQQFSRQALHAKCLTLSHPRTEDEMSWESELPEDMQTLLAALSTGSAPC